MGKKPSHNKKSSLKSTLLSQQSRLKRNEKAKEAQRMQSAPLASKSKENSSSKARNQHSRPPTVPFISTDRILLIGEGNFSFSCALFQRPPIQIQHLPPSSVTATAFDSEAECYAKYSDARSNVQTLTEKGVEVIFNVDATRLDKNASLKGRKWNKIVWNFPHAGKGITDQDRNILSNQRLILDFLWSAAHALATGPVPTAMPSRRRKKQVDDNEDDEEVSEHEMDNLSKDDDVSGLNDSHTSKSRGTVLITLRNQTPYTLWDIPGLAKNPPAPSSSLIKPTPPYVLLRSFVFHRNMWHGYEHRMTKGERAHGTGKPGQGGEDRTWEFYLKDVINSQT